MNVDFFLNEENSFKTLLGLYTQLSLKVDVFDGYGNFFLTEDITESFYGNLTHSENKESEFLKSEH